jgi:hypothetical protein
LPIAIAAGFFWFRSRRLTISEGTFILVDEHAKIKD